MGNLIGANIHAYVMETSGPLLAARVAQDVRAVIRSKEPRMTVLGVTSEEKITDQGTKMITAVEYEVAGEEGVLRIPTGEGGGFST